LGLNHRLAFSQYRNIIPSQSYKFLEQGIVCPLIIKLARLDGLARGPDIIRAFCAAKAAQRNGDARYALDLLSTAANLCEEEGRNIVVEDDVRRAERLAEVSLIRREVVRLSPHQKVLLECVYSKGERQSPAEVYRKFNNLMRLTGREQVSHKTLSELVAELELYGFVEVERKGRG